jgi:hypothetical protein
LYHRRGSSDSASKNFVCSTFRSIRVPVQERR